MDNDSLPTHYLYPGTLFAQREPHLVTTVLGSCVAVCLWDPVARIGGINHYLLPLWNGDGLPTPKYGNIAISKLVEKIADCGGSPYRLIAKLFGGASMWHSSPGLYQVGERNIALAQTQLAEMKIQIAAADLGGNVGRKVIFDTGTGAAMMRRQQPGQNRIDPNG